MDKSLVRLIKKRENDNNRNGKGDIPIDPAE